MNRLRSAVLRFSGSNFVKQAPGRRGNSSLLLLGQKGQNFCIFTKFCRLHEPFPIQNSKHTKTSSDNWPLDSTMLHVGTQNGVFSALRSAFKHIKGQKKSNAIKYCLFYQCRHVFFMFHIKLFQQISGTRNPQFG